VTTRRWEDGCLSLKGRWLLPTVTKSVRVARHLKNSAECDATIRLWLCRIWQNKQYDNRFVEPVVTGLKYGKSNGFYHGYASKRSWRKRNSDT